jgi:Vitamin K-dependent gamma-carboxylase
MPGALTGLIRYGLTVARSTAASWTAFWHTPADPTLLGLIRVLTGLMLVYTHAVWGTALADFFGPTAWLSPGLVRGLQANDYSFSFWFWVPARGLWPAHIICMAILVLFTIGLFTRVTSVLALIVAISYANRVPAALFGLDQINIMLALYLAIGPSGQALSIDRWLATRRMPQTPMPPVRSAGANLALRLIQVHMCVIYFSAGVSKLQGVSWWSGDAMWRAFANLEYQSMDMTRLAWHPWLVNFMTHASVAWELSFCVLIWHRLWRPAMLAGAIALHVGIGACLGMWTFGLVMLIGCAAFLPGEAVQSALAALASRKRAVRQGAEAAASSLERRSSRLRTIRISEAPIPAESTARR